MLRFVVVVLGVATLACAGGKDKDGQENGGNGADSEPGETGSDIGGNGGETSESGESGDSSESGESGESSGGTDADGDGFDAGADCDDGDDTVFPGASEVCDERDNDCDGNVDEGVEVTYYADADADGYGDGARAYEGCLPASGYATRSGDCDDGDASANPGADETCDDVDDDCNGVVDDNAADADTWYEDRDRDGYGTADGVNVDSCDQPYGYADNVDDCDDTTASVSPAAHDVCNGVDDNCDGNVDDTDGWGTFYVDADGDGYGDPSTGVEQCDAPDGYVTDGTDCDDADEAVHPTASDAWYDGVDTDCDGADDYDADGDGHASDDYDGDDCNDRSAAVYPGAPDTPYDGVDADCGGGSDYDQDGDGYDASGYGGDDCDDTRADVYPGAPEIDTTIDHDCDGALESAPVAVAAIDPGSELEHCLPLYLDGTGSYDPDGSAITWRWSVASAPSLSSVTTADLQTPASESPEVFLDVDGDYTFALLVTDTDGNYSAIDEVTAEVALRTTNSAPVSDAGADQSVSGEARCTPVDYGASGYVCDACPTERFIVDGSGSTDADGEPLTYAWSIASGSATIVGSSTNEITTVDVAGDVPATLGDTVTTTVIVHLRTTDCFGATSAAGAVTLTYQCTGV